MKYPKFTTILIASSLLMPAVGMSQTSGSSSQSTQTRPSSSSSSSQSGSQYGTGSQSGTSTSGTSSSMRGTSSSTTPQSQSWSSRSMSNASDLQRISEDELENRVTASNLIGKTVKDQTGETIGEVKDINLTQALQGGSSNLYGSTTGSSSGLASVSGDVNSSGVSGTARVGDRTATGSINSSGVSGTTGRTGTSSATGSSDLAQTSRNLATSAASMLDQGDVQVIIEVEDADAFVAVPASELRYDQSSEELTIQRSLSELQRVAQGEQSSSASRAAE